LVHDHLNVIPARIKDECCIVIWMVMRPQPWLPIAYAARVECVLVELVDLFAIYQDTTLQFACSTNFK
jgi:hypothetical protein